MLRCQKLLINLKSAKYPISVNWMLFSTLLYSFVIRISITWHDLKNDEIKKSLISLKFKKILLWISLVTLIPLWQFLHPRSTLHTHYALTVHKSIMELIRYCFLDQKYTLFHHEINTIKISLQEWKFDTSKNKGIEIALIVW